MKNKAPKLAMRSITSKLFLLVIMLSIGVFTAFASANTYEVVTHNDVIFSSVITSIILTKDRKYNGALIKSYKSTFNEGSFGIPKNVKLPETKQHIDITNARLGANGWLASRGLGQTFINDSPHQKVFGQAVIYMRYNTPTTQHIGDVLTDDIINVVTTEGWQLGYQVTQTAGDPSSLKDDHANDTSHIVFILVDEQGGSIKSFQAKLVKVGQRI
jgi:hypothetical protein